MYKSPIEVYCNEVYQKFNENFDNACVNAVIQAGFHVDKEELARALAYDRGAYEAGYTDGRADGRKERDAEIVRCENCKWWYKNSWGCTHPGHGFALSTPDFFCADGECKGDEE